jgi:signal transduction histidine kinase
MPARRAPAENKEPAVSLESNEHRSRSDAAPQGAPGGPHASGCHFRINHRGGLVLASLGRHLPWLIAIGGGLISSWAALRIDARIEKEARATFQMHALDFQTSIATRLRSYEDVLFGIAGLYRHTEQDIAPKQFDAYVNSLDLRRRLPAVNSVTYAKYFPASERERFLARYRRDFAERGNAVPMPHFVPGASDHMVITRVYPPGLSTLGINLFALSPRLYKEVSPPLSAAQYRPNTPLSSGIPLQLREQTVSLGVRLGVFDADAAGSARLAGTVGLTFSVGDFFREALPTSLTNRVEFKAETIGRIDGARYDKPVRVFSSQADAGRAGPAQANGSGLMTTSFVLPFGGALLRVQMSEPKAYLIGELDKSLPFAVLIGGLLFFGMAGVLSRNTLERNRELTEAIALQTQDLQRQIDRAKELERELAHGFEEERRRIGYELHDDLGQRLTGMSLSSKALAENLRPVSGELAAQAEMLERNASAAIGSVRALAHGLMPVPAGRGGLRSALEQLAIGVSALHGVRCVFDFDDPVDIDDQSVAAHLYRIAQEAVNNAVRHAHATRITVRLDEENGKVVLAVSDNGDGFQAERDDTRAVQLAGAGIRIMAYRASAINYTLEIDAGPGRGTTIRAAQL